jgi:ATP-binding cassette, subfamily B, bacterial
MTLIDPLPPALAKMVGAGERLIAAAAADLTPAGDYGVEWLIVGDERLRVCGEAGACRLDFALADLRDPAVQALVGNAAFTATMHGEVREIVRFSIGLQGKFGRIARYLDDLLKYRRDSAQGKEATAPEMPVADEQPRCPTCELVLPEGTKVCPACIDKRKVVMRLLGYLRPYRAKVALLWVLMISGMVSSLCIPYITKPLVDDVLRPLGEAEPMAGRLSLLNWWLAVLISAYFIGQAIAMVQARLTYKLAGRLALDIRGQVYRHLQQMSLRFFDKRKIGNLIARVTQDTASLESVISEGVQSLFVNALLFIGILTVLLCINWQLTLLVLIPVPIVVVGSRWLFRRAMPLWNRTWFARSRLYASVNDTFSGIRVVKAFARESSEVERFNTHSKDWYQSNLNAYYIGITFWPILWLTINSSTWLVWYFGGAEVIGEELSLGTLIMFIAYLDWFYGPVKNLTRIADFLARGIVATERVFEVLDSEPDVKDAAEPVELPRISGAVEFKDVTFSYEKHRPALKKISLSVQPGEMIGLVGHSGSGKSTTINLLCRLYEPDSGQIMIDGVDIRAIRQQDLRSQIGVVLQDTFLFNGSIADNIAYARPDAALLDIISAAKAANAHDFIVGKPDGYDTNVGERGQALSGGERQRIAIARAILHDPRILILDEATSSVDTETESQIQEAIRRLVKGRTTFAIAHRLSTLRHADRLVVLKAGEIAEVGTHQQLLDQKGEFFRLVDVQQAMSKIVEVA